MAGIYKIGIVSHRTGLSVATLRLWEDEYGLLAPERSAGGTRLYSESDVERVLYIRSLVRERGYTLRSIASIIDEARLGLPPAHDRVAMENVYLQEATNRERIEEGRRMAEVHLLLRQIVRAESGWRAAITLLEGTRSLTGADNCSLGLYRHDTDAIQVVATVWTRRLVHARPPIPVSSLPRAWQDAVRAREAFSDPDMLGHELPSEITSQMTDRTRSFHVEPLMIGARLVGVLIVGSLQRGGIGHDARTLAERLAVPAGPAIHYHASSL